MRAQAIIMAMSLSATFGHASWPAAIQHLLGATPDRGDRPSAHVFTSSRSPCGELPCHDLAPNMTHIWTLCNHTQAIITSLKPWIKRSALLNDVFDNANDFPKLMNSRKAFDNRLNFDAREDGQEIRNAMWGLAERTSWVLGILNYASSSLTNMDNDRSYLAGLDSTDEVDTESNLRRIDSLCPEIAFGLLSCSAISSTIARLKPAAATLDHLIKLEVASITSKSVSSIWRFAHPPWDASADCPGTHSSGSEYLRRISGSR